MKNALRLAAPLVLGVVGLVAGAQLQAMQAAQQARTAADRAAARVGALVATAASASRMRADGLAAMPTVRAAIETDATTVRDMARVEGFVFKPGPLETIELFQRSADGRARSLWRTPEREPAIRITRADESRIDDDGHTLVAVAARASDPLYAHGAAAGIVAVATRVDGAALADALASGGGPLALAVAPSRRLAGATIAGDAELATAAVAGAPSLTVQAAVAVSRARQLGAGLFVAGILVALAVIVGRRRRRDAAGTEPTPAAVDDHDDSQHAREAAAVVEWARDVPTPITHLTPQPDAAPLAAIDPRADQLAPRYRLLRPIARGSAADVYLAQAFVAGAPPTVALKLLGDLAPADRARYLDAARRQAAVTHAHVARVFDVGDGEVAYVAMEYVEGCTVEALLRDLVVRDESLPRPQVLEIIGAVCSALDAAYDARALDGSRAPLLHGAVKPSNVLIGRNDVVRLADFGAPPSPTDHHAPDRDVSSGDRRSDIYAVGVLLHELVTGRRVLTATGGAPLPPPSRIRRGLPRALDEVVARATRFNLRGRHATAGELYAELLRACKQDASAGHAHFGELIDRARRSS